MQAKTTVQVSMDLKTKEQLDYLTLQGGFDSPAAFIRSFVRVKYIEDKEEKLNKQTIKGIEQSLRDYKKGNLISEEDFDKYIKKQIKKNGG